MTYSFNSTGQITFNTGSASFPVVPTKDEKWQRLAWEQEQQRRSQKEIDEEREELRGIYKFHKLPVPDYIVPEIVPEVNFGSKNFYPSTQTSYFKCFQSSDQKFTKTHSVQWSVGKDSRNSKNL